ncbi:hypothetical protein E2C01_047234 [Portunus trituberculatus]|uniref:Nucleic-acid-binding protein from transposon X-element n=1 Tax=Portunus trituberculatus TaxID=210409 RepID=A0A5B7G7F0_PORTR|nr:hypothetical protein [Portunus trituberculatus]
MGKWLRLKVRSPIPTRVAILQLVYWIQSYLLPLLHCPGCQKIGHSIITCRSAIRCSRCSGPHLYHQQDVTCTRQHHCFQCGGAHGPQSECCPFNQEAHQLYTSLTQEENPLHTINKKLRELQWPKPQAPRRPSSPPPPPSILVHMASTTKLVCLDVSYSAATGGNRFSVLTDLHEEEEVDPPQETPGIPAPTMTRHRRSRRSQASQHPKHPPSQDIPCAPNKESELQQITTIAKVHQPQDSLIDQQQPWTSTHVTHPTQAALPSHANHHPMPPHHDSLQDNTTPTPTKDSLLSGFLILLQKGCELYQKGSSLQETFTALWPTLSVLLSSFLL